MSLIGWQYPLPTAFEVAYVCRRLPRWRGGSLTLCRAAAAKLGRPRLGLRTWLSAFPPQLSFNIDVAVQIFHYLSTWHLAVDVSEVYLKSRESGIGAKCVPVELTALGRGGSQLSSVIIFHI
jgi:hypothetical protein